MSKTTEVAGTDLSRMERALALLYEASDVHYIVEMSVAMRELAYQIDREKRRIAILEKYASTAAKPHRGTAAKQHSGTTTTTTTTTGEGEE